MPLPSHRSTLALLASCAAALAGLCAPAVAAAAEGQIIVRYEPGADAEDRAEARDTADVVRDEAVALPRTELVTPETGTSVAEAIAGLERAPEVAYAEPDQPRRALRMPNDSSFWRQWALENTGREIFAGWSGTAGDDIDVVPAWDLVTGSTAKIAVVDSGVALDHPDLRANLLTAEGRDFVDGGLPNDGDGHGTHVTGTIGASGDNAQGVTGVAWAARIVPIRVLDDRGDGTLSDVIAGYRHAAAVGARVVNLSLGGDRPSQTEYDALRTAPDVLFVAAAGNDGADVDATDSYPCAYDLPNVVCVAATDGNDHLASFSNYGATSVDLAAPGVDIYSTYYDARGRNTYTYLDGTSMATPHVAGAAALLLGRHPELTPWQAREMLLAGAHPEEGLAGKVATGGRLDVFATLNAVPPTTEAPVAGAEAPQPRLTSAQPSAPATPATPVAPVQPAPTAPAASTPAPVTASPAAPATAADRTAPALGLTLASRVRLRTALARGLRVPARCSERCSASVEVTVDGRTAKRLGLSKRAAKVRVATGAATISGGATRSIAVRFTAKAKRALRRTRSVKVAVRVTATDAAGNRRTRARSVTLGR